MFKIPEKIKIGFVDYEVTALKTIAGDLLGGHSEEHAVIEIAEKLNPQIRAKIFTHECLHGIFAQFGIPVEDEEAIVTQLATGVTQVINQIVEFNVDNSKEKQ